MKNILKIIIFFGFLFNLNNAVASKWNYKLDPSHTSIDWKASHFGFSKPGGKFAQIEGNLYFDEKKPANSEIEAIIKISNLVTGSKSFNDHLKSKDFFDESNFPIAKFRSTKIKMTGKNTANVYGNLTIKDVTKRVVLKTKLNKVGINPITQKKSAGFTANVVIKRSEFGINYGIPSISDKVELEIEAEAGLI